MSSRSGPRVVAADDALVPVFAALGDRTRWTILATLGEGEASASTLAGRIPVTRQAIAKHLAVLRGVGLVEAARVGRELRYRVVGGQVSDAARRLKRMGGVWDRRPPVGGEGPAVPRRG
ncbi:MAG: metalloregulator ArsR/SmtB family transcription factor [Cryobacterium sp.]